MKTTYALILMLIVFSLSACKKDNTTSSEDGIVGLWELVEYTYEGNSTTSFMGQSFSNDFEGTGRDMSATVEFKADGTYISKGDITIDLSTDLGNGQTLDQPYTFSDFIGFGTYEVNGSTMTATNLANNVGSTTPTAYTIDITKLSGDDLDMEFLFNQSTTQQGATNVLELDGRYVFVRR